MYKNILNWKIGTLRSVEKIHYWPQNFNPGRKQYRSIPQKVGKKKLSSKDNTQMHITDAVIGSVFHSMDLTEGTSVIMLPVPPPIYEGE